MPAAKTINPELLSVEPSSVIFPLIEPVAVSFKSPTTVTSEERTTTFVNKAFSAVSRLAA